MFLCPCSLSQTLFVWVCISRSCRILRVRYYHSVTFPWQKSWNQVYFSESNLSSKNIVRLLRAAKGSVGPDHPHQHHFPKAVGRALVAEAPALLAALLCLGISSPSLREQPVIPATNPNTYSVPPITRCLGR